MIILAHLGPCLLLYLVFFSSLPLHMFMLIYVLSQSHRSHLPSQSSHLEPQLSLVLFFCPCPRCLPGSCVRQPTDSVRNAPAGLKWPKMAMNWAALVWVLGSAELGVKPSSSTRLEASHCARASGIPVILSKPGAWRPCSWERLCEGKRADRGCRAAK